MSDKNKKNNLIDDKNEQAVKLEEDKEYEYEEDNRLVFKRRKPAPKEEVEEEVSPQNNEEYKVKPQLVKKEGDGLIPVIIDNEMRSSFLEYAMSVIVARALPDARDGLKPVHRRILYDMLELGITHNSQYRKSARIVGDVLGKYHPHGDSSVYEAMVRLAQDFSMRYPLVDGHGNFGSIDGDQAAAMRYTEARMSKLASEMIDGIKKNTVDFADNYDSSEIEPVVLPARFPNLLISGSSGIAVGLATEIPPHNLRETIDAVIAYAKNNDITTLELMEYIKGPDFPTGATILGTKGIIDAYETGRGKIPLRSVCKIQELASGKNRIIVTEIPYAVKKTTIVEKIVELHKNKIIDGIAELRDESNREGIRIVIDVKRNHNPHILLNKLFQKTPLQMNFNANMVALVKGEPKLINLKDALSIYLDHQKEVLTRRLQFDLNKDEERHHILLGFKIATDNIDQVIKIIRASKTDAQAQETLSQKFELSEKQTKAILDMSLRRLTGLSIEKTLEEIEMLQKQIQYYLEILNSEQKLIELIIDELNVIKEKYGDERRTQIDYNAVGVISEEDLIAKREIVLTKTVKGYVKRIDLEDYHTQKRGGIGSNTMKTYSDDEINLILKTSTHTDLLLFSNLNKVYKIRAYQIPEATKQSKGTPFVNIINNLDIHNNEKIISILEVNDFSKDSYLTSVTEKGIIKKTHIKEYENVNKSGKIAFNLKDNDKLVECFISNEDDLILVANNQKSVVVFNSHDIRPSGRIAIGVKAIKLDEEQKVISASCDTNGDYVLSVSSLGYAKLTHKDDFRLTKRGAKGITALNANKAGNLVFSKFVNHNDQLLIITKNGLTIRTDLSSFPITSRNTKGVKLINLRNKDEISNVDVISIDKSQEDDQNPLNDNV
ncbi:DNA gyrase subunit A [Mycoplasmopsis ciconiae]|uniref:DNA gyrase subunit A n=1 Tax=Mycoplasmopsis ciconiae TaxID=561067 RepID=A0ABU7MLZ8_9BACT|nr:DNA gyrase subunit A [Mycoplasmopsis ciconiae]